MLERQEPLTVLGRAVEQAARRRGSFALVVGEAGVGKTSLLRAFVETLGRDVRALVGVCDDLVTPRVLGPFRDMARSTAPALAAAISQGDRDAVLDAVMAELDDPLRSVVVVIEDIHWADDATLDVLRYLAPRIASLGTLIAVSYRESEITPQHGLQRVLGALAGTGPHRLPLRGLSRHAVGQLSVGSGLDVGRLMKLTDGNPFFVTEILANPDDAVPSSVADAVMARVRQLDERTQDALAQLAVLPWDVEPWLIERLIDDATPVLAQAESRGLIRVTAAATSFRHELARHAILDSLPRSVELALHTRALAALMARDGVELSRILHHAVAVDDAEAILRYGPPAARAAAGAGAHRQALAHFEQVLRWSGRLPRPELAHILEEVAWELHNAQRFTEGAEQAAEAVRIRDQLGDRLALGEALMTLSRMQYNSNKLAASVATIARAVAILEDHGDDRSRLLAQAYQGALLQLADRPEKAMAALDGVLQQAESTPGCEPVAVLARNYLGCARMDVDDRSGRELLLASIAAARRLDEQELVVRGYGNLSEGLAYLHDYDGLRTLVPEGLAYASQRDFAAHRYVVEAYRCYLVALDGDPSTAERDLRHIVDMAGDPGNTGRYSLPLLARLAARREATDAMDLLERAWANAVEGDSLTSLVPGAVAALEVEWLLGEDASGLARARVAVERLYQVPGRARYRGELLHWLRRVGADDDVAGPIAEPYATGLRGDWRAAAAAWQTLGEPYESALALASADDEEAWADALSRLDDLGAKAAARRVRNQLRDRGVRMLPRGRQTATRAHPHGLTVRQAEVLALLAQDLTNAEIADRLVVSVRTVDHHVSAILQKLNVATRQQAADIIR